MYITPTRAVRRAILELQPHLHSKLYICTGEVIMAKIEMNDDESSVYTSDIEEEDRREED